MASERRDQEVRETVTSPDGTMIAYWRSGAGPALVLVHGTTADHTRWRSVEDIFRRHFTVCSVDRRGRGGSGDADTYAIEREFEDVAAVVDSLERPVHVLGHSYGGLCALGGSLLTSNVDRMVLYEPPVQASGALPTGLIERLESLIAEDRREEALVAFVTDVLRMSPAQLDAFRSLPVWKERVAAAHTLPRELRVDGYPLADLPWRSIPTLILEGSDSPAFLRSSNAVLHEALPDSTIVVMPGQQHVAMDTAPDLFAKTVVDFLIG